VSLAEIGNSDEYDKSVQMSGIIAGIKGCRNGEKVESFQFINLRQIEVLGVNNVQLSCDAVK
jgi:hypothetical protein